MDFTLIEKAYIRPSHTTSVVISLFKARCFSKSHVYYAALSSETNFVIIYCSWLVSFVRVLQFVTSKTSNKQYLEMKCWITRRTAGIFNDSTQIRYWKDIPKRLIPKTIMVVEFNGCTRFTKFGTFFHSRYQNELMSMFCPHATFYEN